MVDLHCHILPGVDDGSDCPDTSCRMAAMAADCGVRYIVATPHCNNRGMPDNFRSRELLGAFRALQEELDRWSIPIRILPGSEVLARENLPSLLEGGKLITLNGSRYLLVEFYFNETPEAMDRYLEMIFSAGLVPVVAHPERYYCVQDAPRIAAEWVRRGCLLQLNKGSILGSLGEGSYYTSARLLRDGLAAVIATDAHHFRFRSPDLTKLLDALERRFPEVDPALLLQKNPAKIAKNQDL
jgi:protein-tyrosine phosphatase